MRFTSTWQAKCLGTYLFTHIQKLCALFTTCTENSPEIRKWKRLSVVSCWLVTRRRAIRWRAFRTFFFPFFSKRHRFVDNAAFFDNGAFIVRRYASRKNRPDLIEIALGAVICWLKFRNGPNCAKSKLPRSVSVSKRSVNKNIRRDNLESRPLSSERASVQSKSFSSLKLQWSLFSKKTQVIAKLN